MTEPVHKVWVTLGTLKVNRKDKLTGDKYVYTQHTEHIATLGDLVDVYYVMCAEHRRNGVHITEEWRSMRWGSKLGQCIRVNPKMSLRNDVLPRFRPNGSIRAIPGEEARELIVTALRIKQWCRE